MDSVHIVEIFRCEQVGVRVPAIRLQELKHVGDVEAHEADPHVGMRWAKARDIITA